MKLGIGPSYRSQPERETQRDREPERELFEERPAARAEARRTLEITMTCLLLYIIYTQASDDEYEDSSSSAAAYQYSPITQWQAVKQVETHIGLKGTVQTPPSRQVLEQSPQGKIYASTEVSMAPPHPYGHTHSPDHKHTLGHIHAFIHTHLNIHTRIT